MLQKTAPIQSIGSRSTSSCLRESEARTAAGVGSLLPPPPPPPFAAAEEEAESSPLPSSPEEEDLLRPEAAVARAAITLSRMDTKRLKMNPYKKANTSLHIYYRMFPYFSSV